MEHLRELVNLATWFMWLNIVTMTIAILSCVYLVIKKVMLIQSRNSKKIDRLEIDIEHINTHIEQLEEIRYRINNKEV